MLTAPLATMAVGTGFWAQTLLKPGSTPADRDVLEALIAQPSRATVTSQAGAFNGAAPATSPTAAGLPPTLPSPAPATGTMASGTPAAGTQAVGGAATAAEMVGRLRSARIAKGSRSLQVPQGGPEVALEIRVALLKLSARPRLSAEGPWQIRDRAGHLLAQGGAGDAPDLEGLMASNAEMWMRTTAAGALQADGRAYGGLFRVLRAADGFQVVNHLSLESYISSVVGGEMPSSWNMEALKAQAVAARSYAMAHMARPADQQWHLGDTTRWQNYEGLSSVSGRTRQATTSTAGVILSYQGGIVESLYAATQQIVDEAHGQLGASMSQTGAQELAQQGLRFNEILGRYYQGASLARLQAGAG
jgi:Stage II sporulation protein